MIHALVLTLGGIIGTGAGVYGQAEVVTSEPKYPEHCWSDISYVRDDRVSNTGIDKKEVGKAILAHVIRTTGSSNPGDQPARSRIADKLSRGAPAPFVEVQYFICDQQGKVIHERSDQRLPDLHLQSRRAR